VVFCEHLINSCSLLPKITILTVGFASKIFLRGLWGTKTINTIMRFSFSKGANVLLGAKHLEPGSSSTELS
jgi:hypothetical protein